MSTLLIFQILNILKRPTVYFLSVLIVPAVIALVVQWFWQEKETIVEVIQVATTIIGTLSLLVIGTQYRALSLLQKRKNGKECWWLIVSLIVLNLIFIALPLLFLNEHIQEFEADFARVILSLSFVYVASTILMRIYPYSMLLNKNIIEKGDLSPSELDLALKIEGLVYLEKVYQESSYNRGTMAQELEVSESFLSKIVNVHFQRTVPQLLNFQRIEEAKEYLRDTTMEITVIAPECGFNSIATFNRVFKDIEGVSPSMYRNRKKTK